MLDTHGSCYHDGRYNEIGPKSDLLILSTSYCNNISNSQQEPKFDLAMPPVMKHDQEQIAFFTEYKTVGSV